MLEIKPWTKEKKVWHLHRIYNLVRKQVIKERNTQNIECVNHSKCYRIEKGVASTGKLSILLSLSSVISWYQEGKLTMRGNLMVKVSIDKIKENVWTGKYAAVYRGFTHTHINTSLSCLRHPHVCMYIYTYVITYIH